MPSYPITVSALCLYPMFSNKMKTFILDLYNNMSPPRRIGEQMQENRHTVNILVAFLLLRLKNIYIYTVIESNQKWVCFSSIFQVMFYHCGKVRVAAAGTRIASAVKSKERMDELRPACLCLP